MGGVYKTAFSTETEKNAISDRFRCGFGDHLGPCWDPLDPFCQPRASFCDLFRIVFSVAFPMDFKVPPPPRRNSAARWLDLWGPGKTSNGEKSVAFARGKRYVGEMA